MGFIYVLVLLLAVFFIWVIVTVGAILGFTLQPVVVFIVVLLLIVLISIT